MNTNPTCGKCGEDLDDENWYPTSQKSRKYACKKCVDEKNRLWRKANPEITRARYARANRNRHPPFNENKACPSFLGCHIAERVLSHVFKDVEVMPPCNPGYDFICNRGKRIDVKSSCIRKNNRKTIWRFNIKHNKTADHFLCLAFDNRDDLNPLHAWLIPGDKFSHLGSASIAPSRIDKWNEYRLDITKISNCCDTIRGV